MENSLVKITIALPKDNIAGADTESVWAEPQGEGTYKIKNVPFYAKGISYEDTVEAEPQDGTLVFTRVVQHSGHSTYRIYAKSDRRSPEVMKVLDALKKMHCDMEGATDKLVSVDVLPEADIYAVYRALEEAEQAGILEFDEGHCGHLLRASP